MIEFFVQGEPRPKQSFRVAGRGRGFTPARVKTWQADVGWEAQQAMRAQNLFEPITWLELAVVLEFHLGNRRRVDLDNLSKAVLDGLNGIIWKDDQQVIELRLTKQIEPETPGVHVRVGLPMEFIPPAIYRITTASSTERIGTP